MKMRFLAIIISIWFFWTIGISILMVAGLFLNCAFVVPGCYEKLNHIELLSLFSVKGALIRSTLVTIVCAVIVWLRMFKK